MLVPYHHHNPYFIRFQTDITDIALPEKFTFPFCYQPHDISKIAVKSLQDYLVNTKEWFYDFGLGENANGMGKMFGVLVVKNEADEVGFLVAFSGKLLDTHDLPHFVPAVFDRLRADDDWFKVGEEEIMAVNREVDALLNADEFLDFKQFLKAQKEKSAQELLDTKERNRQSKIIRQEKRAAADALPPDERAIILKKLDHESGTQSFAFKDLGKKWQQEIAELEEKLLAMEAPIRFLKEKRKKMSNALQQRLFDSYTFLNIAKKTKNIGEIFEESPPSGAGECAAPKLLQYAFLNNYQPIALAEFWWGSPPASEIRKHGHFYPACKSKCKPILTHMLEGMTLDDNPLEQSETIIDDFDICYEDEVMLVINKPTEFLSVPGINISDSVFHRMREKYPDATGPLIVHRLDQATSGLMLIAKTEAAYHALQNQFMKRRIKKRYVAILEGIIAEDEGLIELPIRVDLDNRPRQLVCYQYGKPSITRWEVIERTDDRTRVHFYPITGRTHQLRMHASHQKGLNTPILGDDLYGTRANRLHLHAEQITFAHPITKEIMTITKEADF